MINESHNALSIGKQTSYPKLYFKWVNNNHYAQICCLAVGTNNQSKIYNKKLFLIISSTIPFRNPCPLTQPQESAARPSCGSTTTIVTCLVLSYCRVYYTNKLVL